MKKVIEIEKFLGTDNGSVRRGMITESDGVTLLSGGSVKSLLREREIYVGEGRKIEGVYSFYQYIDPEYETQVDADWVYENIFPRGVRDYVDGYDKTARILVADVGKPGKTENGYRNVLSAYSDGEKIYVLYDAVYNVIDQRREDYFSVKGSGYTVEFESQTDEERGSYSEVCTLTQIWLDIIEDGEVKEILVDGIFESHGKLSNSYGRALLVATKTWNFKYASADYAPSLGTAYTVYPDKVYRDIYPVLATDYPSVSNVGHRDYAIVRYSNREDGDGVYADKGEKMLLIPDMRLINCSSGSYSLEAASSTMPKMKGAVQHFDRLFGYYGNRLFSSVSGDCTDYSEAVNNLPATGGFATVTSDSGGFTAITSFDGKVVAFTAKSMMTLRGRELPLSLSYEGAYGCKSSDAMTVCGGKMYFASDGGIYRYSGSTVDCISGGLPYGYAYEDARIASFGNLVVVQLVEEDGIYLYNPMSECWTKMAIEEAEAFFYNGGFCLYKNGAYKLCEPFCEEGDFSFAVSVGAGDRKRICSLSLTAKVGFLSELCVTDESGNTLMTVGDTDERVATRTCLLKNKYIDLDSIYFSGRGDVTLYALRLEYLPIDNRRKHII